jgi:hypothetical protein
MRLAILLASAQSPVTTPESSVTTVVKWATPLFVASSLARKKRVVASAAASAEASAEAMVDGETLAVPPRLPTGVVMMVDGAPVPLTILLDGSYFLSLTAGEAQDVGTLPFSASGKVHGLSAWLRERKNASRNWE